MLLPLALTVLAGCAQPLAPGAASTSGEGGTGRNERKRITAAVSVAPATVRSSHTTAGGGNTPGVNTLEDLVHAGATRRDNTDTLRPLLAEALPSVENGLWRVFSDGRMETTWTLKNGIRWQDGSPFTSQDLLFTLTVCMDRDMSGLCEYVGFGLIENATALDAHTITVTWKQPHIEADSLFTTRFAMPLPRHLLESFYEENKRGVTDLPYWTREFVGAGPFQVRDWVPESHVLLTAFDGYVLGRPRIDEIVVKFIPDSNAVVANMLAGEIDVNLGRGMSIGQALEIRDHWSKGHLEVGVVNWLVAYPQFIDPRPTVVLDVRFRRALVHAIDRQEMSETLQGGLVPVAHAMFDTSLPEYRELDPAVVKYDFDPRLAIARIESSGYVRGLDGLFRDPAGERLSLEIRVTGTREIQTKAMLSVADYWQRIGVGVEPMVMGAQRRNDREYRATRPAFELAQNPDGYWGLRRARSTETPLLENNYSETGNVSRYISPEFDALLDRFFTTIPISERKQILGQILHHESDLVTTVPLFRGADATLVSNRLQGVGSRTAAESTEAWNVHEWDVR